MSLGMATRPAIMMTAASGVSRQTCTAMTEAIARPGWPSQYMFVRRSPSRPSCRSTQSIGEKIESSSHSQAIVDSATGVVHGSSTRKRTTHLPRKSATRMLASTLPSTTISAIETTVKTSVLPQRPPEHRVVEDPPEVPQADPVERRVAGAARRRG